MPLPCCGGRAGSESVVMNCEFKETKIPKLDEIFADAKSVLDKAEAIRSGIEDAKADMMVLSGAHNIKDAKINEALILFLASVGCDNGADKLAAPKIDMSAKPPCKMDFPSDFKMSDEHKEFQAALECFVKTLVSAPDQLTKIGEELTALSTKASEAVGTAKDDATEAGLGAMDAAKAVAGAGSNTKSLATAAQKVTALGGTATAGATSCKDMAAGLSDILAKGKELAGKADKAKSKMSEIQAGPGKEGKELLKPDEVKKSPYVKLRNARLEDNRKLPSGDDAEGGDAKEEKTEEAAAEASPEQVKPEIADV